MTTTTEALDAAAFGSTIRDADGLIVAVKADYRDGDDYRWRRHKPNGSDWTTAKELASVFPAAWTLHDPARVEQPIVARTTRSSSPAHRPEALARAIEFATAALAAGGDVGQVNVVAYAQRFEQYLTDGTDSASPATATT